MQTTTVSEDRVEGVLMSRVNPASVDATLKFYGLEISTAAAIEWRVRKLAEYFGSTDDVSACDICDGQSSPDLPACPFCNDGKSLGDVRVGYSKSLAETPEEEIENPGPGEEEEEQPETDISAPEQILATSAVYEEEPPAPKKRGRPSKAALALRAIESGVQGSELQTDETLDAAVAEVKKSIRADKANGWQLGKSLYEIYQGEMWKLRTFKAQGKPAYKTWDQFLAAEVQEITTRYAWVLMKVATAFSEEEFVEQGPSRLYATLAVDDVAIQKRLLEKVRGGAPLKELVGEAKRAREATGKKHPKDHSKTQKQKTGAKAGKTTDSTKITVATVLGKHSIPLYAKGSQKGKTEKLAKTINDKPWGSMELVNDVRAYFSLVKDPKGQLRLNVHIKRID